MFSQAFLQDPLNFLSMWQVVCRMFFARCKRFWFWLVVVLVLLQFTMHAERKLWDAQFALLQRSEELLGPKNRKEPKDGQNEAGMLTECY